MLDRHCRLAVTMLLAAPLIAAAQNADQPKKEAPKLDTSRGDAMIAEYFRRETQKLADACLADIQTADDWNARKDEYRRQLREMLGLDPMPEKTDLAATVTGTLDHEEFTVEKLHFQSRPGLYVTGNLYVPKQREGKLPAILYVCGHGNIKKDGISYGAKSHYQHHGAWFARNGYVCLVIDTLQLGEIEGIHHGTYRYGMWWWLNRGYTPAGVEAWNCVRALDYLQSRPEVDPEKLGVTGRSGGGAYSWWIAAIDERIKCAVPVAGITDLQNHVVDGCVEGHCDCMYMVNTYRWDYPQIAALVAPRPLLISNTDSDGIFPLDGVVRVFDKARRIYTLLGKRDQIGLNITSGGHKDTQELQVTCMRWFNHHLRGYDGPVTNHAEKFFEPEQLKVFNKLPEDQINTKIHETFVAAAPPPKVPESKEEWEKMRGEWVTALRRRLSSGWPASEDPPTVRKITDAVYKGVRLQVLDYVSEPGLDLRLFVLRDANAPQIKNIDIMVMENEGWADMLASMKFRFEKELADETSLPSKNNINFAPDWLIGKDAFPWDRKFGDVLAFACPRGLGRHCWDFSEKKQVQHRRRFMLLGLTLEQMQAWDVLQAMRVLKALDGAKDANIHLLAVEEANASTILAALASDDVMELHLQGRVWPKEYSPPLLNAAKTTDFGGMLAVLSGRAKVTVWGKEPPDASFARQVAEVLGWEKERLVVEATGER
jgi:dienelactone hydrolase